MPPLRDFPRGRHWPAALRFSLLSAVLAVAFAFSAQAHVPAKHGFQLIAFNSKPPAIPFSLPRPDGTEVTLADFRGKVLLLNFWATWCPPCVREMPAIEAAYQKYKGRDLEVLAISLDEQGAELVTPFVEKLELTFQIALDKTSAVAAQFGARDLPSTFLIDREGRVIAAAKGERDWFSPEAQSYLDELLRDSAAKVAGG